MGNRIAIYARVSTTDKGQDPENQLVQLGLRAALPDASSADADPVVWRGLGVWQLEGYHPGGQNAQPEVYDNHTDQVLLP